MNLTRPISSDGPQRRAANPGVSAWVAANAGCGKTHVLVQRVIRLLLEGHPPERILCLTFTNAAAAEMSRRLYHDLGEWATLDDLALRNHIRALAGDVAGTVSLSRARTLFACALDAPGGLKIQTIHAFCERLLQRFPLEAGVVPGFSVLDEQTAAQLLLAARKSILAGDLETSAEGHAIRTIVRYAGAQQFDELIMELLKRPLAALQFADEHACRAALETVLGLSPGATPVSVAAAAVAGMDRRAYAGAAGSLERLGNSALRISELIHKALAEDSAESALACLNEIFLTKGEPRKNFPPAKLARTDAAAGDFLKSERQRLCPLFEQHRAAVTVEASSALIHLGARIIAGYERAKRALGAYDYDDLIVKSLNLFSSLAHRGWVLYKLDAGIDHLLIDEAQDTSREQWQIIQNLTEDFFTGAGARGSLLRSVFAVGDEKQSIFSFQGADPRFFRSMRDYFAKRIEAAGQRMEKVPLTVSFRSTAEVLATVDAVFASETHEAFRTGAPGLVELWPLEEGEEEVERDPWRAPVGWTLADHPRRRLARRIARTIRRWIDDGEMLEARGRPVQPSDILILLRSRTTLMDELVRALKLENLPVAGADRLELTTHIAVMDLVALGHFALLPQDDQMLACVLKSPLLARDDGGMIDDDDLFVLAHPRGRETLWQRLHQAVADGHPYRQALARLAAWHDAAGWKSPYEFFSGILNEHSGMRSIVARLGQEAVEPIGEFLSRCLDHDVENAPSLQSFLGWFADYGAIIKRDMDLGTGEIRVMTVHGAKGLESNIVFLPDTCAIPDRNKHPKLFFPLIEMNGTAAEVPVWRVRLDCDHPMIGEMRAEHHQRQLEEHERLLYVAMTRAADRLYVCGASTRDLSEHCWYFRIRSALMKIGKPVIDGEGGTLWRYERPAAAPAKETPSALPAPPRAALIPLPPWAEAPPPPEGEPAIWLTPSRPGAIAVNRTGTAQISSPLAETGAGRFRRGILIHRLLQSLPDVPPAEREGRARAYLSHTGHGLTAAAHEEIAATVMRLLEDSAFSGVFASGSLAEIPLAAHVSLADGREIPVVGRIDRLVVNPAEVLILDFKTNRPAPVAIEHVDPGYIRQLALYRRAMAQLFPDRAVRAALLWTDGPRLMEVPAVRMEEALA
jgi:ATP-dependent helicase/nuclease subunit A